MINGNPGKSNEPYCRDTGCTTGSPGTRWAVSLISYGNIQVNGNPNLGPANPAADYYFLLLAGRDIVLNGNYNEDHPACDGSCPGTIPVDIEGLGGILAAHEQIQISGNPDIFGFLMAEDAIACSDWVDTGDGITLDGAPDVLYDCNNPPNPWDGDVKFEVLSWQEFE